MNKGINNKHDTTIIVMEEKTGSEILVECLENENVDYIFGIPGEQTIPIMEELRKSDIQFITTRHEQGAAFMADVYSRITGSTGVCLSTLGPGATNLLTGVGNASLDHSSVVALTSQRETSDKHKHSHQLVDTNSVFEAVTKLTDEARNAESIPEQVRKSFEVAQREKKGATHLELPHDVTLQTAEATPLDASKNRVSPSGVQESNINTCLTMVEKSDNPIIIAGQSVLSQNASDRLEDFCESSGIPAVTTFMGKGSISDRHNKSVGTIGFGSDDHAMDALKQSDLVITVGYDYIEYHPENWNIGEDKTIIHVDSTTPEIDRHYGIEMTLIGNIGRILEQMNKLTDRYVQDSYGENLKKNFQEKMSDEYAENETPPFTPQQTVRAIREVLSDNDILISDVGSHKYWFSRRYPTYEPNSFIVSNGFASMGVAVPGSVSASLCSQENAVAVTGDGGFMMNMQEIETASRIGASPTIVVLDDEEYTAISMEQNDNYDELYGSSFDNPDFKRLAESFGVEGYRIEKSDEFTQKLSSAVQSDSVSVVSVPIDPSESYKLESQTR